MPTNREVIASWINLRQDNITNDRGNLTKVGHCLHSWVVVDEAWPIYEIARSVPGPLFAVRSIDRRSAPLLKRRIRQVINQINSVGLDHNVRRLWIRNDTLSLEEAVRDLMEREANTTQRNQNEWRPVEQEEPLLRVRPNRNEARDVAVHWILGYGQSDSIYDDCGVYNNLDFALAAAVLDYEVDSSLRDFLSSRRMLLLPNNYYLELVSCRCNTPEYHKADSLRGREV